MNNKQNKNSVVIFDHELLAGKTSYKVLRSFPGVYRWYMEGSVLKLNEREAVIARLVADGRLAVVRGNNALADGDKKKSKANKDGAPDTNSPASGTNTGEDKINPPASDVGTGANDPNSPADETDLIPDEDEEEANDGK